MAHIGHDAFILQVCLDEAEYDPNYGRWNQPIANFSDKHIYVSAPDAPGRMKRNYFYFRYYLARYCAALERLFSAAVKAWGMPDIIHAHVSIPAGYAAARLANKYGIPVIVHEHYSGFESDARFAWRLRPFLMEMGKRIDGFYTVSEGFSNRIKSTQTVDVDGVINNPVDTDIFRLRDNFGNLSYRIVTVGNFSSIKGTTFSLFRSFEKKQAMGLF